MANKKMIQPGEFAVKPKKPPPPVAMAELLLAMSHNLEDMTWNTTIFHDGVMLRFSTEIQFILMTARGARQIAAQLNQRADELDQKLAIKEHSDAGGS